MHALVSIHDVMPHTLVSVRQIVDRLYRLGIPPACVYLLVVPGRVWRDEQLKQLHDWQRQGFELAGHGWFHETDIKGLYHRLHGRLMSRNVAEHLALDEAEIIKLIRRNHAWFVEHDFQPPELYVPPAWAMGPVKCDQLKRLPFRYYETQFGIWDIVNEQFRYLPLIGFEAHSRWQASLLNISNRLNIRLAANRRPLRIAMHPYDHCYYLRHSIVISLAYMTQAVHYRQCFDTDALRAQELDSGNRF